MDNGKCVMDNEGFAFGDIFKIISEGNTTIVNYQLSIIHSCVSAKNGNLLGNISLSGGTFYLPIDKVGK